MRRRPFPHAEDFLHTNPCQGTGGGLTTTYKFVELDDSGQVIASRDVVFGGYPFVHDFAVTEHFYVLIENSVGWDPLLMLSGKKAPAGAMVGVDRPAWIHCVPRAQSREDAPVDTRQSGAIQLAAEMHGMGEREKGRGLG